MLKTGFGATSFLGSFGHRTVFVPKRHRRGSDTTCWDRGSRPRPYRNHTKQKYTPTHKETQYFTWFGLNAYVHGRVAGFHYTNMEITEYYRGENSHYSHSPIHPSPSLTPRETISHISLILHLLCSLSHFSLLPQPLFIQLERSFDWSSPTSFHSLVVGVGDHYLGAPLLF